MASCKANEETSITIAQLLLWWLISFGVFPYLHAFQRCRQMLPFCLPPYLSCIGRTTAFMCPRWWFFFIVLHTFLLSFSWRLSYFCLPHLNAFGESMLFLTMVFRCVLASLKKEVLSFRPSVRSQLLLKFSLWKSFLRLTFIHYELRYYFWRLWQKFFLLFTFMHWEHHCFFLVSSTEVFFSSSAFRRISSISRFRSRSQTACHSAMVSSMLWRSSNISWFDRERFFLRIFFLLVPRFISLLLLSTLFRCVLASL